MAKHNETGFEGEQKAIDFLVRAGYSVKEKNYRFRRAEIDVIVEKDDTLIFVEVKTRSGKAFGEPEDFVDERKRELIIEAADQYIYETNWQGGIRFDIISITVNPNTEVYHIEDAFY